MTYTKLSDWTLESIKELLHKGYNEDTWFDFKEIISSEGADRLRRVVASFANQTGGFIVFGISDNKSLEVENRLVGIGAREDYPTMLGNLLEKKVFPRPEVQFLNPPLTLKKDLVIHVCQILESSSKPISVAKDDDAFIFPLRTSRGTSSMAYEEIRQSFLGYAFMKDKLLLLREELSRISKELSHFGAGPIQGIVGHTIQAETLSSCLFSAHGLLQREPFLVGRLSGIKTTISLINADVQICLALASTIGTHQASVLLAVDRKVKGTAQDLKREIDNLLVDYEAFLKKL